MKYRAFHKLSYGLYIIATKTNGKNAGYIGNTVFQITSEPSQIAISCHKKNASTQQIIESKIFSVSVLGKNASTSLIGEFGFMSSDDIDKFRNVEIITAKTGAPIVTDSSVAWFDCKVTSTQDIGSHILIIGEVLDSEVISDEEPLTYAWYREKYKMLSPKNAPTYIEQEKLEEEKTPNAEKEQKPEAEEQEAKSTMEPFICTICGFQYNPEEGDPTMGIPPGTPFEDLPEDYKCPICNAGKEYFKKS
ncbi:NADH-FMN oxidoreductase RutF, flavin reductase (DIM6/NTAB) family [Mariniphaga anaerophila]|uniref:NADH-FMN oxidoreductase RutF, flavin reductase (DIM6/NTAB) family n=1 Tax=Mariniphaga anaerophila TaxID=1484053 RepID=A0A1M5A3Q3_9BACT|nr:flavin reductase [Mariniphaga anaerophila]SHF24854.1 NADH-FMN oxidoreductase RutF, flavin reductase (DIM6/NTAB) family [Mariniphaga anaerophila]